MRVKVCGMTDPEQVKVLEELGVDLAGFIFYPKSPRYMRDKILPEAMKKIKGHIAKVGVFVNEPLENLLRTIDEYRLDMVQLHGEESAFYCDQVANYITVIKAFRLGGDNNPVSWQMRSYEDYADFYLFDTFGAGYGGTGHKFDWKLIEDMQPEKMFFLSGGIDNTDADALNVLKAGPLAKKLFAIDINSRFELTPGIKDLEKIKKFIHQIKT